MKKGGSQKFSGSSGLVFYAPVDIGKCIIMEGVL